MPGRDAPRRTLTRVAYRARRLTVPPVRMTLACRTRRRSAARARLLAPPRRARSPRARATSSTRTRSAGQELDGRARPRQTATPSGSGSRRSRRRPQQLGDRLDRLQRPAGTRPRRSTSDQRPPRRPRLPDTGARRAGPASCARRRAPAHRRRPAPALRPASAPTQLTDHARGRRGDRGASAPQLAARLAPGRRRARLRRAGGRQDDVRARRAPRAGRHRAGDQPDVHDRPPLRRRPRARSRTSTSTGSRGWPARTRRCSTTTSTPDARRVRRVARAAPAARGSARVAARVRLEHAGGDRRADRDRAPMNVLGFDTATPATVGRRCRRRRRARSSAATTRAPASAPATRRSCSRCVDEVLAEAGPAGATSTASASASARARSPACGSASRRRAALAQAPGCQLVGGLDAAARSRAARARRGRAAGAAVLAVIDARRGEVFAAAYGAARRAASLAPAALRPEALAAVRAARCPARLAGRGRRGGTISGAARAAGRRGPGRTTRRCTASAPWRCAGWPRDGRRRSSATRSLPRLRCAPRTPRPPHAERTAAHRATASRSAA